MRIQYIIMGTTHYALEVYRYIKTEDIADVLAFCSHQKYITDNNTLDGLPIVAFEDLSSLFDMSTVHILNTIGYTQMNGIRERVANEILDHGYILGSYISERAMIYSNEDFGQGNIISPGAYIGPYVKLGMCNIIHPNATLTHHDIIGDYNFICAGVCVGGDVTISNNCFIGLNSTIKNGLFISPYTLIGSASNVIRSTIDKGVYLGNPARSQEKDSICVSYNI